MTLTKKGKRNKKKRAQPNKDFNLFHYILLIELILIFSFAGSYVILSIKKEKSARPGEPDFSAPNTPDYRYLYQNYRVLNTFLNLPIRTDPVQDTGFEIDDPFIRDILNLKSAQSFLEEKNYAAAAGILENPDAKDQQQHPYILQKRDKLYLKYLYVQKKHREFLDLWNSKQQPPGGREFKLFLIGSYIKTGNNNAAFEMFKDLFARNRLTLFNDHIPAPTQNRFLRQLDFDYWFKRFKYLAETNSYTEFVREKNYAGNSQLVNLFYAEFEYRQKRYDQCRRYLQRVNDEKLLSYKERILFKLNIRDDNTTDLDTRLDALKRDPEVYREVLADAASILLINGKLDLSLDLYSRYLEAVRDFHRLRIFIPGLDISLPLPIRDADYWKTLWLCAWISYQKKDKEKALDYFKQGMESPITPYRIANTYWFHRGENKKSTTIDMSKYPFTYYYVKVRQGNIDGSDSLKSFIRLLNHDQEPLFKETAAHLKALVHYNLPDEAVDFIRWVLEEEKKNLSNADKHTLMLIESIIYLRQRNYAMAFIRFRDNFACYRCIRLPQFLSRISLPIGYTELIDQYSAAHKVDRALVLAIIREESFFRPNAVSYADACGLMQLLLKTAREMAYRKSIKIFRQDLFDPETNIRFGIEYLRFLLDKYNDKLHLALAAYNAGDNRVDEWLQRFGSAAEDEFIEMIPFTDTRNYVKNILRNYHYYKFYYGE
jgi:soluble lytic murein transglycosylase-like protein